MLKCKKINWMQSNHIRTTHSCYKNYVDCGKKKTGELKMNSKNILIWWLWKQNKAVKNDNEKSSRNYHKSKFITKMRISVREKNGKTEKSNMYSNIAIFSLWLCMTLSLFLSLSLSPLSFSLFILTGIDMMKLVQNACENCSQIQIWALTKHRFAAKFMYLRMNNRND